MSSMLPALASDRARNAFRLTAVAIIVGAITWVFLTRTDPDRIAEAVQKPYAAIAVVPDSIHLAQITGSDQGVSRTSWALGYTTLVSQKVEACQQVKITRTLESMDKPGLGIISTRPSLPIASVGEQANLVFSSMPLPGPLPAGRYSLTVDVVCFAPDATTGVAAPLGNPARSFPVCFTLPAVPRDSGIDVVPALPSECVAAAE